MISPTISLPSENTIPPMKEEKKDNTQPISLEVTKERIQMKILIKSI